MRRMPLALWAAIATVTVAVLVAGLMVYGRFVSTAAPWTFDRPVAQVVNWTQASRCSGAALYQPAKSSGTPRLLLLGVPGDRIRPLFLTYANGLRIVETDETVNPQLKDEDQVVSNADKAWSARVAGTETLFVRRGHTLAVLTGRSIDAMVNVADSFVPLPPVNGTCPFHTLPAASLPNPSDATYTNPVIDTDFADPTMLRASDGWYYAYSTESLTVLRMAYIQVARSRDMVHWQLLPDGLPQRPSWASRMRDFWAPGVIEGRGHFYLYFAAMPNSGTGMCIGVAVSRRAAGPFHDMGHPLICAEGFADIDPMPFDDPVTGRHYLYWGSDSQPLHARELAADRLGFRSGSKDREILSPNGIQPYERLIEAPFVFKHGAFYYLFYSGNDCCSKLPSYAVMVARSHSPIGPFVTRADALHKWGTSPIIHFNDSWDAPGHNAVIASGGEDWLVYHAINRKSRLNPGTESVRRPMLIDRIQWMAGWPRIARDVPSFTPKTAPRIGRQG